MTRGATVYEYQPVGFDLFDARTRLQRGDHVVKTEIPGCPRNGTMGHCFVASATTGDFIGLVLVKSLRRVR